MSVLAHKELGVAPTASLVPIKKRFQHPLRTRSISMEDNVQLEQEPSDLVAESELSQSYVKNNNFDEKLRDLQNLETGFSPAAVLEIGLADASSSNVAKNTLKELVINHNDGKIDKSTEQLVCEENIGKEFALTDHSYFQIVGVSPRMSILSSTNEKIFKKGSVEQLKKENIIEGPNYPTQTSYSEEHIKQIFDSNCDNRAHWDLNAPMDSWDTLRSESGTEHDRNGRLNKGIELPNNFHMKLVHTTTSGSSRNGISDISLGLPVVPEKNMSKLSLNKFRVSPAHKNFELGLDLQLKPPSSPNLRMNLGDSAPDLSLSLIGDSSKSPRIKQEPHVESLADSRLCKSYPAISSAAKPADLILLTKTVRSDACHNSESNLTETVKREPVEEFAQECRTGVTGKSPLIECYNEKITHFHMQGPSNADINSVSPSDKSIQPSHSSLLLMIKAKNEVETSDGHVISNIISCSSGHSEPEKLVGSACIEQDVEDSNYRSSNFNTDALYLNCASSSNAAVVSNLHLESNSFTHLESNLCKSKKLTACDAARSQGSEDMDYSNFDDSLISKEVIGKNFQMNAHNENVNNEIALDNMVPAAKMQKHNAELFDLPDSLNNHIDGNSNHDLEHNELEDGEKKDASVHITFEGSDKERELMLEVKGVEDSSVRIFGNLDIEEKQIQVYEEIKTIKVLDKCGDSNYDPEDSAPSSSSGYRIKSLQTVKEGQRMKNVPMETESGLARASALRGIQESNVVDIVSRQANARELGLSNKYNISSEINANDSLKEHGDSGYKQGRLHYGNVATSMPYPRGKPWFRERPTGKYVWQDRLNSQDNRNWRYTAATTSKFEHHEKVNMPVVKNGSDGVNSRRGHGGPNNSYYRRNFNHQYTSEYNEPKYHRFARSGRSDSRDGSHNYVAGPGRLVERPLAIEMSDVSHFSDRRWSPRSREGQFRLDPPRYTEGTVRDATPDRFILGDIHDAPPLDGEEEDMRGLPDEFTELPDEYMDLPSYPHHHLQYRRGRRSLSPVPRRGPPMHLPRRQSPHRWSPSGRDLDIAFNRPPLLIRDRSRHLPNQTNFPSEHDSMVGGPDSPSYSRLPCNGNEFDYRASPRSVRRFRQEPPDEYFESYTTHPPEHDEEIVDRRESDDRRFSRRFLQHPISGSVDECPSYPLGHGPCRPASFCRDKEIFHDEVNFRTEGRNRNTASNMANRLGVMVDQDSEYRRTPSFHREDGYNDFIPKRRRF